MDTLVLQESTAQDGAGPSQPETPMSLHGTQKRRLNTTSKPKPISLWTLMSERWMRNMAKVAEISLDQFIDEFKSNVEKFKTFVENGEDYPEGGMTAAEWFESYL